MPLYEYECLACYQRFERIQRVSDPLIRECPSCGGQVRRLLGVPALQFKGSGWYVTDYGKGNGGSNGSGNGSSNGGSSKPMKDTSEAADKSPKSSATKKETAKTESSPVSTEA